MSEMSKTLRAKMRDKAKAMSSQKDEKVDGSDWSPAEPLNADVKTGMRPISRRAYKTGGKVMGESCAPRADRKPRKSGGEVKKWVDAKVNRDVKEANDDREGVKHVGALKKGGVVKKADGGQVPGPMEKPDHGEPRPPAKNPVQQRLYGAQDTKNNKLADKAFEMSRQSDKMMNKGGRAAKNNGGQSGFSTQKDASEQPSAADQERMRQEMQRQRQKAQEEGAHGRKAGGRAARKDGGKVNYGPMEMPDGKKGASEKEQRSTEEHQRNLSNAKRGKAQQYADGGYLKFKGDPVIPGMKKGGKAQPERMARKAGGRAKKGGTNVNIVIQTKPSAPSMPGAPMGDMPMPKPPGGLPVPVPPPGMPTPPMGGMPMPAPAPALGGGLPGGMPPMARKSGGRITKVAKSYKDMEAGSGGAEGRLQKTDIAKTGKSAPAYKKGGKVYSSYKDMDAGAGSGEGRLEKAEIQKKRMH